MALVFNRIWLSNAQEELRSAAVGAALAAAGELVTDEILNPDSDPLARSQAARFAADLFAAESPVSGELGTEIAVRLGRTVVDPLTGHQEVLETDYQPTSVLVMVERGTENGHGVPLLAPALTGRMFADVGMVAEATISNLVTGVRPVAEGAVPAWPIAVLEDSEDPLIPSWVKKIEQRQGADDYGWSRDRQIVTNEPDGLPEIVLSVGGGSSSNLQLIDIGSGLQDQTIRRQFENGLSREDLASLGGELSLIQGPIDVWASGDFEGIPTEELKKQVGQRRLFPLYSPAEDSEAGTVQLTRLVAGRIMDVIESEDGVNVIIQPGVVATRTAVLDEAALLAGETDGNPYLYKISLTQ